MDDFRPPSGHGEGEGVLAKPVRGGMGGGGVFKDANTPAAPPSFTLG